MFFHYFSPFFLFLLSCCFRFGFSGAGFPDRFLSAKAEMVIGRGHGLAFSIAGCAAKPSERGRIDGVEQAV